MKRLILSFLLVSTLHAWASFGYYSPVDVNTGQVPSTQTDFPMLINLTDARFKTTGNGGHVQHSSGFDIRPYSDTGLTTALTYELERYNASSGEVVMWVKIASLSDSTVVYLAYGDAGISADGSDGANTFSNNFVEVYHLKNGTTLSGVDSVHNAAPYNMGTAPTPTPGQIDGGAKTDSTHTANDSGFTWPANAISLSCWANGSAFGSSYNTVASRMFGTYTEFVILAVKSTGKLRYVLTATTTRDCDGSGSATLSTGTWYHLAITYDSSAGMKGYVNGGAADCSVAANGNYAHANGQTGGIGLDNAGSLYFTGTVDEVRWSSVARSQDWNTTEYNSGISSSFETLGTEVTVAASATGNFFMLFP